MNLPFRDGRAAKGGAGLGPARTGPARTGPARWAGLESAPTGNGMM